LINKITLDYQALVDDPNRKDLYNTKPTEYRAHLDALKLEQQSLARRLACLESQPNGGAEAADIVRDPAYQANALSGEGIRGIPPDAPIDSPSSGGGFDNPGEGDIGGGGFEGGFGGGGAIEDARFAGVPKC